MVVVVVIIVRESHVYKITRQNFVTVSRAHIRLGWLLIRQTVAIKIGGDCQDGEPLRENGHAFMRTV